jgi:gas vesicle protein GvpO
MSQVIDCVFRGLAMLKMKVSSVTSVGRDEAGWRVTAEVLERRSVPDTGDLLGVYELRLDEQGSILRYERTRIRRRSDLGR